MTHLQHHSPTRLWPAAGCLKAPAPEVSLAREQFRVLYGHLSDEHGQIGIYTKQPYAIGFFPPSKLDVAAAYACEASQTTNIYHLVNLVAEDAVAGIRRRSGRGSEAELKTAVALVAEIDTVGGRHCQSDYPTQDQALAALDAMPLAATMMNLSGLPTGGLHVFWSLASPVDLSDAAAHRRVKELSRGWQEMLREKLRPYRLDSTFDLVRVLRVAGCVNHKYGALTRPLEVVPSRRYVLSDFEYFVEPRKQVPPAPVRIEDCPRRVKRCKAYLTRCPDAVSGKGGHEKTFRAACECARFGLPRDEASAVLRWFNETKTPPGDKWSEAELEHKLDGAYEKVADLGQFGSRLGTPQQ
jgi:hypothetical protein